ncbi:hypothetical protein FLONG3_6991 [Fusarium longipes]|uniref:DH domain-containing protein n=1 Tax=Fusarium longipes TaxID=694270 RepID=A0A395SHU3_9HYPO|nr:hypothetical protein FLONG3_6991 [Fusarium longipes]
MADPLSVAASIAGLISITVEAAKFLKPYVSATKETPPVASQVYSEVQSIEIILIGLQNATSSLSSIPARNTAWIGVNQVITVLTDGVLLFSDLQDELRSLSPKNGNEGIPIRIRLRWARKESTFTALLTRLQGFKSSMTLILMILKSDSDRSATQHHQQLSANIDLLLESNHSLSRRLMNLEDSLDSQTIASRRMSFLSLTDATPQGTGSEASQLSNTETESSVDISKFDFQDDLEASRPYRRAKRDTMDYSFRSSIARSNSWSVFSGLSLGDISIMSVIALPVYQEDITNAQHYDFGNDILVIAEEPQPTTETPLLVECLDILQKMRQLPGIDEYFDDTDDSEDTFHALWAVLRRGYPLMIVLQALDPRITIAGDEIVSFPIPLIWFRMIAGVVTDDDSSTGYNQFYLHGDSTEAVEEFLSEQRHLVDQIMDLADIKAHLEGNVLPRDDVVDVFGQIEGLVNLHIKLLLEMETNLFVPQTDHRWSAAFGQYFDGIQTEAAFIANEVMARTKIRSWLDQDRFKGDGQSINRLTQCLKILALPGQRVSKYSSFLEYLESREPTNTSQKEDIVMAKGFLHQVEAAIAQSVKYEENREVVRDLDHRIEDWRGFKLSQFGDLILFESLNVTKGDVTRLYRGYLFQNILIICQEVKPDKASRTGFLFRRKKVVPTFQQTKLKLKGRIFLKNIIDIETGGTSGV